MNYRVKRTTEPPSRFKERPIHRELKQSISTCLVSLVHTCSLMYSTIAFKALA